MAEGGEKGESVCPGGRPASPCNPRDLASCFPAQAASCIDAETLSPPPPRSRLPCPQGFGEAIRRAAEDPSPATQGATPQSPGSESPAPPPPPPPQPPEPGAASARPCNPGARRVPATAASALVPGPAPQSHPPPPPGSRKPLARRCTAASADPRPGPRPPAPAAPPAAARVPRRPASYLAGPPAASERALSPPSPRRAGARAGARRGGAGAREPQPEPEPEPELEPECRRPAGLLPRSDLGVRGLSAPSLSFPGQGCGRGDGCRPGRRRHPNPGQLRAPGSVGPPRG